MRSIHRGPARRLGLAVPMLLSILLAGCASRSAVFPDRPREQVWTAMVAVAERPDYADWRMLENEVAVEPEVSRILIYRTLRRDLVTPGIPVRRQDREMQIEIRLLETDPPQAVFATTVATLPARVDEEATRYFQSVRELLGEPPPLPPLRRVAPPLSEPVRD